MERGGGKRLRVSFLAFFPSSFFTLLPISSLLHVLPVVTATARSQSFCNAFVSSSFFSFFVLLLLFLLFLPVQSEEIRFATGIIIRRPF